MLTSPADAQSLSFFLSILFFIICIYYTIKSKIEAKLVYILMGLGWFASIAFYYRILYLSWDGGHDWSAKLRLFQYVSFGGWTFFSFIEDACSKIYNSEVYKKINKKVDNIKWRKLS